MVLPALWQGHRLQFKERETKLNNETEYTEFLELCKEKVEELYGGNITAEICGTVKNNGVEMYGLLLSREGETIAPNFYLYPQYNRWKKGMADLGMILRELKKAYTEEMEKNKRIAEALCFDWETFRHRVFVRLVGRERNEKLLQDIPYDEYLDMALVYHYVIQVTEDTQGVLVLNKEHILRLGITHEELRETAMSNTKRELPPVIVPMQEMVARMKSRCGMDLPGEIPESGMYVLSNAKGTYGAVAMTYTDLLEEFSNEAESGFYILPSSVHEVILVPDDTMMTTEIFSGMVRHVNAEHVEETEVLTDSVYYYDRELHTVRRIA